MALDADGKPSFNLLQNYGSAGAPLHFFVFDLLLLNGRDVMDKPLVKRRELLEKRVLPKLSEPVRYSPELKASLKDLIQCRGTDNEHPQDQGGVLEVPCGVNQRRQTAARAVSYLEVMIKLSVMYPQSDGMKFDMDYYRQTHLPMVRRLVGEKLKGLSIDHAIAGEDLPAPYAVIANLLFESVTTMKAALAEHGPELMEDIPNYTNAQAVIQISETS
ncbi:MAG: EthD family reductase [Acidobacteriota bacterium]